MSKFISNAITRLTVLAFASLFASLIFALEPSPATKISHSLQDNEDVFNDYAVSPDGKMLVYRAFNSSNDEVDLYSVSTTGGVVRNLTTLTVAQNGNVMDFKISPDSSKVVYIADTSRGNALRMVGINGGMERRLSAVQAIGLLADITDYKISSDSSRVVYRTNQGIPDHYLLFRAFLAEPYSRTRVGIPLSNSQSIESDFEFVPFENRVIYRGDVIESGVVELFASQTDSSGNALRLNIPLVSGGNVEDGEFSNQFKIGKKFSISPDGSFVVYHADARIDDVFEVFSTSLDSSLIKRKLNPSDLASNEDVFDHRVSHDSRYVIYRSNARVSSQIELYRSLIDQENSSIRISESQLPGGDVFDYRVNPNGGRVTYSGDLDEDGKFALYTSLINGGFVTNLTPNIVDGGAVTEFEFSELGEHVVYLARQDSESVSEAYRVRPDGSDALQLNPPLAAGGNVLQTSFTVDTSLDRIFYLADQENNNVFEVYSSSINDDSNLNNIKLNASLSVGLRRQRVINFLLSPESTQLFYLADQEEDNKFELYVVDLVDKDDELCLPIKTKSQNVAVICL